MKLFALLTNQGTAASETSLCEDHMDSSSQGYAREMGSQSDDVLVESNFVDVTGNPELNCCICGRNSWHQTGE